MWRVLVFLLALAGCTQFPQLDRTIEARAEDADFPDLVPLEPILAAEATRLKRLQTPDETSGNVATDADIRAREEALRARAEALRGDVIDRQTQSRMERGVGGG